MSILAWVSHRFTLLAVAYLFSLTATLLGLECYADSQDGALRVAMACTHFMPTGR